MADRLRSAFCVLANPEEIITYKHNEDGTFALDDDKKKIILSKTPNEEVAGMNEEQICKHYLNLWVTSGTSRTGAVLFCESEDGFRHLHCVFESKNGFTFSALKKVFPKMHIEPTQGKKEDVEDYIHKLGKFEEKGEKVIASAQVGEIIGKQGARSDLIKLDEIKRLVFEENKTPREIYMEYPQALKSEKAVKFFYYEKRRSETPLERSLNVVWLCGRTGCGKSHTYVTLCEEYGEECVYRVSDYTNPFDNYMGQDIVFFDEFRGQFRFADFLMYLDVYRQELRARYSNNYALWTKVYISSPITPYELYKKDDTSSANDKLQQLYRRINEIRYCFKVSDLDHIYYCQKSFPCELDGSPEEMYKKFGSIRHTVEDNIRICSRPPVPREGFTVCKVEKSEEQKAEDIKEALKNGIAF